MEFYTIVLSDVTPKGLVTAKATYGIGFATAFVGGFCSLFGTPNAMFSNKLKMAEKNAFEELARTAKAMGADGVMDVRCQIDGLSVSVSGTAYSWSAEERARREAAEKARREAAERAKREAEEKAAKGELPTGEQCQLCGKHFDHLTYCEINDDFGTRYRSICDGCIIKHNATPLK